jgi:hypothetical protein
VEGEKGEGSLRAQRHRDGRSIVGQLEPIYEAKMRAGTQHRPPARWLHEPLPRAIVRNYIKSGLRAERVKMIGPFLRCQ